MPSLDAHAPLVHRNVVYDTSGLPKAPLWVRCKVAWAVLCGRVDLYRVMAASEDGTCRIVRVPVDAGEGQ